jgi:hypothetical protein
VKDFAKTHIPRRFIPLARGDAYRLQAIHFANAYVIEWALRNRHNLDYMTTDLDSIAMMKADTTALASSDQQFDAIVCLHELAALLMTAMAWWKRIASEKC